MSETMCRVCFDIRDLVSLFETTESIQYSSKIMYCTSIRITMEDHFPQLICKSCVNRLNISYDFKKQCENSDIKLRSNLFDHNLKCKEDLDIKDEIIELADCTMPVKCEFNKNGHEMQHMDRDIKSEYLKSDKLSLIEKTFKKKGSRKKRKANGRTCRPTSINSDDVDILHSLCGETVKEQSAQRIPHHSMLLSDNSNDSDVSTGGRDLNLPEELRNPKKTDRGCNKSNDSKKEQCFTCGKVMSSRFRLKMHMRIHTGEKPYTCSYCQKTFALLQNQKVHERTHTGEKPLVCSTCGKAFAQSAGLVTHQRIHTGETPYCCTLCPLRFRTPGHLQYHIRLQHTGEKNFECNICHRAFITRGDLTQHAKIHTGERPYICTICGIRMARSSHLTRHMLTHTGQKPHRCQICGSSYAQRTDLLRHMKKHTHSDKQLSLVNTIPVEKPDADTKIHKNNTDRKVFNKTLSNSLASEDKNDEINFTIGSA